MRHLGISQQGFKRLAQSYLEEQKIPKGYYIMLYAGGQWGSIAWFPTREEAEVELKKMKASGRMPNVKIEEDWG